MPDTSKPTAACPFCLESLDDGREIYTDEETGVTAHAGCHDMERSANFGDWTTREYDLA